MQERVFIHTPKAAGTSIRQALGLVGVAGWPQSVVPPAEALARQFLGWHPRGSDQLRSMEASSAFGVVRHPFERVRSAFCQWGASYQGDLGSFVQDWCRIAPSDEHQLVVPGIKVRILRFEQLEEDWEELALEMGWPTDLSHLNRCARSPIHLTARLRRAIAERYHWTFENFGYQP